ncbi:hypothetical protein WN53_03060 [Serratia fonticola]|nr:hypothetical protein WN53_03060 [Serratia fonticola]
MHLSKIFFYSLTVFCSVKVSAAIVPVRTDINVQAEVSTAVQIFVNGKDVTNGSINLSLVENKGYLSATTPPFLFIGNARNVSLSLLQPARKSLLSQNGDAMQLAVKWIRLDGGMVYADYDYSNIPVYPRLAEVPDPNGGVKVLFESVNRAESYPLGIYSGTYTVIVTPSA